MYSSLCRWQGGSGLTCQWCNLYKGWGEQSVSYNELRSKMNIISSSPTSMLCFFIEEVCKLAGITDNSL